MSSKNILFQQRQLDKLWQAVKIHLSNGHVLPPEILNESTQVAWLNRMEISKNLSSETTNQLSQWLGYADFAEFSKKNVTLPATIRKSNIQRGYILAVVILALVALCSLGYILYLKAGNTHNLYNVIESKVPTTDRKQIEALIENATAFEFATYQTAPNADTAGLYKFFDPNGPAYDVVASNVIDASKNNWTLRTPNNASYFVLIDTDVKNSDGEKAEIITRENWYLEYFSPESTTSIHTYNNLSTQYYQARKINGEWKIHLNCYPETQ